jgi:hypothetical protein
MISFFSSFNYLGREIVFLFLRIIICGGVFGLSILISLSRYQGGDFFKLRI